jgi:hypothetical protein
VIEELSGSVLLPDATGALGAVKGDTIEELSGSVLLADASGSVPSDALRESRISTLIPDLSGPSPIIARDRPDELSGSFLLDAGSTGALPSVESTGRILAAKAASRAPFAPVYEPPTPRVEAVSRTTLPPIVPLAMPLGSVPPPPPAPAPPPSAPRMSPSEPRLFAPPAALPETPAPALAPPAVLPTLIGVPPPPDYIVEQLARAELASTAPSAPPMNGRENGEGLPPPERSSARLHDFRAMGHDPRARYVLAAFGLFGAIVVLGVVGLIIGAVRKKPSEEPVPVLAAAPAPTPSAAAAQAPGVAAVIPPSPAIASLGAPCTLAGSAHVVAPRAVVQSGVEVEAVGSHLAVGFATHEHEGYAVALDPTSLVAAQTSHVRTTDAIRRVVPIVGAKGLAGAVDVEHHADFLSGRRTIGGLRPFDLGFGGGGLAWAPYRSGEVDLLWTLDGDEPVEAVRAAPLDVGHEDAGWAIAFRRGATIYAGVVSGGATLTPKGPLVKVVGLGPQVGSPTIAAQDGAVLVAWADRAQPSEPWSLRWMRFAPGEASAEAKAFVPSEGGLGEHAMSPSIRAAGKGRFVLAWTEGPVSTHQVRAQTISGSGAPLGMAMAISDSGVNAGQAQLAISPEGRGVVAYLASAGAGPKAAYQVLATPIVCP